MKTTQRRHRRRAGQGSAQKIQLADDCCCQRRSSPAASWRRLSEIGGGEHQSGLLSRRSRTPRRTSQRSEQILAILRASEWRAARRAVRTAVAQYGNPPGPPAPVNAMRDDLSKKTGRKAGTPFGRHKRKELSDVGPDICAMLHTARAREGHASMFRYPA
jgi:hypothetical protein